MIPSAVTNQSARTIWSLPRDSRRQSEKVAIPKPRIESPQSTRKMRRLRSRSTKGDIISQRPKATFDHIKRFKQHTSFLEFSKNANASRTKSLLLVRVIFKVFPALLYYRKRHATVYIEYDNVL